MKLRDFAFLSQASYRGLDALPRNATTAALEAALRAEGEGVLNPDNRFADFQAKQLSGSASGNDPADGYTFLHQTLNGQRGASASAFA